MSSKDEAEPDRGIKGLAFQEAERALARSKDEGAQRQAALELRRALEAFVYEKLWAYRKYLPASAKNWRPQQALRALIQVEPGAKGTRSISVAWESSPGVPSGPFHHMGTDHRPDPKWVSANWYRLSTMLHAPFPFQASRSAATDLPYLQELLAEMRSWVGTTFTSTLMSVRSFECKFCGQLVASSEEGFRKNGYMDCLNEECGVRYWPSDPNSPGGSLVYPESKAGNCRVCGKKFNFPPAKVKAGERVQCTWCDALHEVQQQFVLGEPGESKGARAGKDRSAPRYSRSEGSPDYQAAREVPGASGAEDLAGPEVPELPPKS